MFMSTLEPQIARNVSFSFMKSEEIDDDVIIERLGKIFKYMPPFTPCPVEEYSASRPPNEVIVVKIAREY